MSSSSVARIPRSLEESWGYRPDWRHQCILAYVAALAESSEPAWDLQLILDAEKDPYVRQGLRFLDGGRCCHQEAIGRAFALKEQRCEANLASALRAAIVADRFPEEIAEVLPVSAATIVAFEKLFWDVRRYLNCDLWIKTLPEEATGLGVSWVRTAVRQGWNGLQKAWQTKPRSTPEEVEERAQEVEQILMERIHRGVTEAEVAQTPTTGDDFKHWSQLNRRKRPETEKAREGENMRKIMFWMIDIMNDQVTREDPPSPKAILWKSMMQEAKDGTPPSSARRRRAPDGASLAGSSKGRC